MDSEFHHVTACTYLLNTYVLYTCLSYIIYHIIIYNIILYIICTYLCICYSGSSHLSDISFVNIFLTLWLTFSFLNNGFERIKLFKFEPGTIYLFFNVFCFSLLYECFANFKVLPIFSSRICALLSHTYTYVLFLFFCMKLGKSKVFFFGLLVLLVSSCFSTIWWQDFLSPFLQINRPYIASSISGYFLVYWDYIYHLLFTIIFFKSWDEVV